MAENIQNKTLILPSGSGEKADFTLSSGNGTIYVNSTPLTQNSPRGNISHVNGYYVVYFDSSTEMSLDASINNSTTRYIYTPKDVSDDRLDKKMKYKRLNAMNDDDTSYSILRVNPKLTGNVKVVVDSESNMYLDTFKVSVGLSQMKYRHIPINPSVYYGKSLMTKFKSLSSEDFFKIEDSCYDLFDVADDFDQQYYDKYNCGVRTNHDDLYTENYAMLAPLCVRKNLPDFFLVFKVNDYESLLNSDLTIKDRTSFIDLNNCTLVKSFDLREGAPVGKFIRNILKHNEGFVGDVFTGYDYNHFNIYNGISLDRGVVCSISEDTAGERFVNNQVAMNDRYTLGFERNRVVSKDIVNFEFMFDDLSEPLFAIPTYFGLYVKLNDNESFSLIGSVPDDNEVMVDNNIPSIEFDPTEYPKTIYGVATPYEFVRLNNMIEQSCDKLNDFVLKPYTQLETCDSSIITNPNISYVSNKLNDVLDPGEHYRVMIKNTDEPIKIFDVIASNYFSDDDISDVSYTSFPFNFNQTPNFEVYSVSINNIDYRSNIKDEDKEYLIKHQIKLISDAFNKLFEYYGSIIGLKAYNDRKSSFSILKYYKNQGDTYTFSKIASVQGNENNTTDASILDESSSMFGYTDIPMYLTGVDSSYFPHGFESLGNRYIQTVKFYEITNSSAEIPRYLLNKNLNKYSDKTIIYKYESEKNTYYPLNKIESSIECIDSSSNTTTFITPDYCTLGYGNRESYLIKPNFNISTPSGKIHFYENYPLTSGVCSIIPLRDYDFDVIDNDSMFFIRNENNPTESTKIEGGLGEYASDDNVYKKALTDTSEEKIADYCDKYRKYNVPSLTDIYMNLNTEYNLCSFFQNMRDNGHTKFDISLVAPYCCKWKLLATDMTGNRMRVMYPLSDLAYQPKYYSYDSSWDNGALKPDGSLNPYDQYWTTPHIDIRGYDTISCLDDRYNTTYFDCIGFYKEKSDGTGPESVPFYYERYLNIPKSNLYIGNADYVRISFLNHYQTVVVSKTSGVQALTNSTSYWIPTESDSHIGYVVNPQLSDIKYINDLYDDESGNYSNYITYGEGSIDDILKYDTNINNKFSKVYKYGNDAVEFVSCGIKIRIKTTSKSQFNIMKYVGYSAIVVSMSGNNHKAPGSIELFIDEVNSKCAFVIYNGIESRYNEINFDERTRDSSIYRLKHSHQISEAIVETIDGEVYIKIKDDGFIEDVEKLSRITECDIILTSKPTKKDNISQYIQEDQIVVSGKINKIEDGYITLEKTYCTIDSSVIEIKNQNDIDNCINSTNNVDMYIYNPTDIFLSSMSLTLGQIKKLKDSYTITIKEKNKTKSITSNILSIDIVDSFELTRENNKYENITSGYVHPSYAVPVMKDVFTFDYIQDSSLSQIFNTSFDGCNINIANINTIKHTWMKKVPDLDSLFIQPTVNQYNEFQSIYQVTQIPANNKTFIDIIDSEKIYKKNNKEYSILEYTPKGKQNNTIKTYTIYPYQLTVNPREKNGNSFVYQAWVLDSSIRSINVSYYPSTDFVDSSGLEFDPSYGYYNGKISMRAGSHMQHMNDYLPKVNETVRYKTPTLTCLTCENYNDASIYLNTLTKHDSSLYLLYNYKNVNRSELIYFDGIVDIANHSYRFRTHTFFDINDNNLEIKGLSDSSVGAVKIYFNTYSSVNSDMSNLIYFTIQNDVSDEGYTYADVVIGAKDGQLDSSGALISEDNRNVLNYIDCRNITSSVDKQKKYERLTSSVTLLKNYDPLVEYWYQDICRMFTKFDTYVSGLGIEHGFEKNNYLLSRGVNLKTKVNDDIIDTIFLSSWSDSYTDTEAMSVELNISNSIIDYIMSMRGTGYIAAWDKAQSLINKDLATYIRQYANESILKYIDINKKLTFKLYVDETSDDFVFYENKPSDTSKFTEVKNVSNELILDKDTYYMNVNDLGNHSYYAEITLKLH